MAKRKEKIGMSVRVVIIKGNKVLIIRQQKHNKRNVCIFPGGMIERGEDIFAAAVREAKEESCLKIKPQRLLYLKEVFAFHLHGLEFYILGKIVSGRLSLGCDPELPKDGQVLKEVGFKPMKDLKKLSFYPQELRTKLYQDWRRKFKNTPIYLGTQRFSPKQYRRLFGHNISWLK